jgi:DNA-binding NtrC family response regulator
MKPARILVLDGSNQRREALSALLRTADHYIVQASEALSALVELESGVDLLLLDLSLPELDQYALRQAILPSDPIDPDSLAAAERRHLAMVLRHTSWNKRKAAQLLGISRSTLLNKVRKYDLQPR